MALRGCISIDRLALQILLRENPEWHGAPVAVTKEERPQSLLLAVNKEAREKGLGPGMRYANALSLVPSLRARAVPQERIARARDRVTRLLSSFTPDVEPCPFDADAFWVSVDGLHSLFPSESAWAEAVRGALAAEGFAACAVIGFTRFGTYIVARSRPRSLVFASRAEEQAQTYRSSIDILPLSPKARSALHKLEVHTVKRFVGLPEAEIVRRFGTEAGRVRQAILSDDPLPIQSRVAAEAAPNARHLDSPTGNLDLLMLHVDEMLALEVKRAEAERQVISGLSLALRTEDGEVATHLIRPAVPTLQAPLLQRLILLRLSACRFASAVENIEIRSERAQPSRIQEELFAVRGRDLKAGARVFAALRARFGNDSVTTACLIDSYLPERSFRLVPQKHPALPTPRRGEGLRNGNDGHASRGPVAVRRILFSPRRISLDSGKATVLSEASIVSGSWWGTEGSEAPYLRHYSYQDSPHGILWVFVDAFTGPSWLQGVVD
ncbi:MAG: Y-family DNA polymerase [Spirochaetia bacterium]